MFFVDYLVWFSFLNLFNVLDADPRPPVIYAQDFCHFTTINHKIKVNEKQPSIIIRASRGSYKPGLDCQLRIVKDDDDDKTGLWFDERLVGNNRQKEEYFFTEQSTGSDEVVLKFMTTADSHGIGRDDKEFEIIITLFEYEYSDESTTDRRVERSCEQRFLFDCGNNICIKRKFFCNGLENCGNGWDEPKLCKHSRNNNYFDLFDNGFWFGFKIVATLLLIGILLGIISCICKKCDENKKLKKQFLLDELNRHSGYRLRGDSIYSLKTNKTPLYPQLYPTYGVTDA